MTVALGKMTVARPNHLDYKALPTSAQRDWDAPLQPAADTDSRGRGRTWFCHKPGGRHPPCPKHLGR